MKKHIAIVVLSLSALSLSAAKEGRVATSKKPAHCCNAKHTAAVKKMAHTTGHNEASIHAAIAANEAIDNRDERALNDLVRRIPHAKARKDVQEALPGALRGNAEDRVTVTANVLHYPPPSEWGMMACD